MVNAESKRKASDTSCMSTLKSTSYHTDETDRAGDAQESMLLAVDVGNTKTRMGLFHGEQLIAVWNVTTPKSLTADEACLNINQFLSAYERGITTPTSDAHSSCISARNATDINHIKLHDLCHQHDLFDAIVSSVVPSLTDVWTMALQRMCKRRALVVGPGLKTGLKMRYNNPSEVGADRVADLVAAHEKYGAPVIVVDLGTTTNFEVLDADGTFAGGVIAPGLRLSIEALTQAAARLSMVEVKAPSAVIGKSTREAIQSGAVLGEVARIDGLIDLISDELGYQTVVVISGDDAQSIVRLLRHEVCVDNDLTLRGLHLLYQMNRKQ